MDFFTFTVRRFSPIFFFCLFLAIWLGNFGIRLSATSNQLRSTYGMGLGVSNANTGMRAMGGISQAVTDFTGINLLNPATYGYVYKQGMVRRIALDLGFNVSLQNSREFNLRRQGTDAKINNIALRFPLYTGLGLVLALQPQTLISFNHSNRQIDSAISGSSNHALLGIGYNFRKWSTGFNIGYLFGKKQQTLTPVLHAPTPRSQAIPLSAFPDANSPAIANQNDNIFVPIERVRIRDFYQGMSLNWGLLFAQRISDDSAGIAHTYLKIGATVRYTPIVSGARTKSTDILHTGGNFFAKDTLQNSLTIQQMPLKFGLGFALTREFLWLIAMDMHFSKWQNFQYADEKINYHNTWQMNIGGAFVANYKGGSPLDYVKFKLGASIGNYPLDFNGQQVLQWSLHTGLYVPIKRNSYTHQNSALNLAFEYVNRKAGANFQAQFFNFIIGITLNDLWFLKTYQR